MYCPTCGTRNDDNNFRCVQCSTVLQQGFGGGPIGGASGQAFSESSQATAAVILAALSWAFCGPVSSFPALIIARGEIRGIEAGLRDPVNTGTAKAAFWLAAINLGLFAILFVFWAGLLGFILQASPGF